MKKLKNSEVKKYFGCFGKVKDVKLMPNKTGFGMGFVVFASPQSVEKVLDYSAEHVITGIEVSMPICSLIIEDNRQSITIDSSTN